VKSLKEMVSSLESELQSSTSALKAANEEAARYRSKANQLQGIVESAERTRQQQQKGIKKQATSMQEAHATITRLTSRNGEQPVHFIS
jgi:chromosome segregation ATPase